MEQSVQKIMAEKNKVKELGKDIMMMNGGDFIIIFGDSDPAELRDYCYSVDVNPSMEKSKQDRH